MGSRSCDALELTREDFRNWTRYAKSDARCRVMSQHAIVRRPRGMMAPIKNAWILTAVNTLQHKMSVS